MSDSPTLISISLDELAPIDPLATIMQFAEHVVLTGIPNLGTRTAYRFALKRFFDWHIRQNDRQALKFDRRAILAHIAAPEVQTLSASTLNASLAALKKLARELYYQKMLDFETWQGIKDLNGQKPNPGRASNWLTVQQLNALMRLPDESLHGLRDRALLATVTGCGLRRAELCSLQVRSIEQRAGRWVFVVKGKGSKIRIVPIPPGVKVVIDEWLALRNRQYEVDAGFVEGQFGGHTLRGDLWLFIPVYKGDSIHERRLNEQTIYDTIRVYANLLGVPNLAPHDLRRTYAKLSREAGADLDQIQFSMGHDSVSTTQKYIGDNQDLAHGPGDLLKVDWSGGKKE
jgi:integrase/recombinase XerD